MLGNFKFQNPTKIIFGENAMNSLKEELGSYGNNILLVYGGGSIKTNGIYDQVVEALGDAGKNVVEFAGVMPNPTAQLLRQATAIVKEYNPDLILAVGGGSVCDFAKALSATYGLAEDPWDYLFADGKEPDWELIPVGCVLTMVGTGSEMNNISVIMNTDTHAKIGHHFKDGIGFPQFSILNPRYTMTLPRYQMVSGIYDTFNHLSEQYFAGDDDNLCDYMIEGLMRGVVAASRVAIVEPKNYEARSNLMWAATLALNSLFKAGNRNDFMVHKMGHAVACYTDATHGMTLSAVSMAYYHKVMPYAVDKFVRFAKFVWGVNPQDKSDLEIATEGLEQMKEWMNELGVTMNLRNLGVTEDMVDDITDSTIILKNGYKVLSKDELKELYRESL